jgi:hypothetical protein
MIKKILKGHEVLLDALVEYQDDKGKYPKDFIVILLTRWRLFEK